MHIYVLVINKPSSPYLLRIEALWGLFVCTSSDSAAAPRATPSPWPGRPSTHSKRLHNDRCEFLRFFDYLVFGALNDMKVLAAHPLKLPTLFVFVGHFVSCALNDKGFSPSHPSNCRTKGIAT